MCVVPWSSPVQGDRLVGLSVLCGGGVVCVNCIVDACDFFFVHVLVFFKLFGVFYLCFLFLGTWWMPGHGKLMKDVVGCVKPRGVAV